MQKNRITNKITPCCGLPFSVMYWWVTNLTLNTEADRQYIISKLSLNGILRVDAWKVLINSGTLEADASLTKAEFLAWFDCERQPTCEQLKLIIEGFKVGNWKHEADLPMNLATIDKSANGTNYFGNVYTKEQTDTKIANGLTSAYLGIATTTTIPPTTGAYWYRVDTAGTYMGVTVTESDFFDGTKYYDVTIEVKDGVATKRLKVIPFPSLSTVFDANSTTKAETGKSIDNYLFENSENLANPNNFKYGYYVSYGDGEEYVNVEFSILSNQVFGNKTYYIKKTGEPQSVAYYDKNGVFISGIATYGASFTTPPNAYLVKINVHTDQISTFMLSEKDVPFSPYFKNFKFQNKNYSENLYKKSMIVAFDSYVSYGDGLIYRNAYYYVAKIPVQVGKTYTIINHAEPNSAALMRSNNAILQGYEKLPSKLTIPEGGAYLLITLDGMSQYNFFGFYEGSLSGVQDSLNKNLSSGIKVLNTYYTVDKKSGDFKTIMDAVNNLNNGATIVINGMFEESVSLLSRKLNLVGVNKFTCGIITNDGDYNAPPVNMSAGSTLKNLTIFADNGNPDFTTPTYAIHHDWGNTEGESIIDDCILISKFNASIGIGTHNNQQVTIRNSKLYNQNQNQPYDYGGLYFHNKKGSGAIKQMLTLENCVIENADGSALIIHDANHRADGAFDDARDTLIRLTHNVFYSKKYGVGAGIVGGDIALDSDSKWGYIKLHEANFGNNIIELNR